MGKRITEDWNMFRNVVGGTTRKELKKYINSGRILRRRGKNGKISIPIPRIDLPHFVYGPSDEGLGRGEGENGKVVGRDDAPGKGKGNKASQDEGDFIEVQVDMKTILDEMAAELKLPNIQPKANQTFEEERIKYNSISRIGPQSLLHRRKTLQQAMRRLSASGKLNDQIYVPGFNKPITPLFPIREDMRYRQWRKIKIPSSNAVIFFARDISGSMDVFKTDIVSDMSWWIDCWIRQFYEKTERCYVVHDVKAKEVDEDRFYGMRDGGGTTCSSAVKYIAKQLKHRYPPERWNVYVFYFSDGDNWSGDNAVFCNTLKNELGPDKVNLIGVTEILPSGWGDESLKQGVDKAIASKALDNKYVRTAGISNSGEDKKRGYWGWSNNMTEEDRNNSIKQAIKELLGDHLQSFATSAA